MYYEVLYYTDENDKDCIFLEFKTRNQALKYYNQHKDDADKFHFWVTKRDEDGFVVEDIIY